MEFAVTDIQLINFRNHLSAKFSDFTQTNLFVGPNGAGKSNLLEAIGLCTALSSFRGAHASEISNLAHPKNCQVNIQLLNRETSVKHKLLLKITEGNRKYFLDGKRKNISDLKGKFPSVTFSPDDLMLVKGSNSPRLKMLDAIGSQVSKNYYTVRKDYSKTLRQKNKILHEQKNLELLDSLNDVLVITGAQLICYRQALVEQLSPIVSDKYSELVKTGEKVQVVYEPCVVDSQGKTPDNRGEIRSSLQKLYNDKKQAEIAAEHCLVGPHKDNVNFVLNDKSADNFASQGQQRSIILAVKFAEIELLQQKLGQKPILLLDDVMSELDESRSLALTKLFGNASQVFITTTKAPEFINIKDVKRIRLDTR